MIFLTGCPLPSVREAHRSGERETHTHKERERETHTHTHHDLLDRLSAALSERGPQIRTHTHTHKERERERERERHTHTMIFLTGCPLDSVREAHRSLVTVLRYLE